MTAGNNSPDDWVVDLDDDSPTIDVPDDVAEVKPAAKRALAVDPPDSDDFDSDQRDRLRELRGDTDYNDDDTDPHHADDADADETGDADDEDEKLESWRARAEVAEARARQAEASRVYDASVAEAQRIQSELAAAKVGLDSLNMRIEHAYSTLEQARNAGDTRTELETERMIREMNELKGQIEIASARLPDPRSIVDQGRNKAIHIANSAPKGEQVAPNVRASHPLARKWSAQNVKWMQSSKHKDAQAAVVSISDKLIRDNWDPQTPGFYSELSKRLNKRYPQLSAREIGSTKTAMSRAEMRTPVAPGRSSSSGSLKKVPGGGNRYQLTQSDIATMERLKLDPKNRIEREEFVKARIEVDGRRAR